MRLYGQTREIAMRLKAQARLHTSGGMGGKATLLPKRTAGGEDHFLFTLAAGMSGGGALAEIRAMDDATQVEASANVANTLGDFSHLIASDRGICVKVGGQYYAVHPDEGGGSSPGETGAVTFVLTSAMSAVEGATATANVVVSGVSGVGIGDPITVYNTGKMKGVVGATGWAMKIGSALWVVEVNQYAVLAVGVLSIDTHDLSAGPGLVGDFDDQNVLTTSDFFATSPFPLSFIPSPAPTIKNPSNFIAKSGDRVRVTYNSYVGEWQVIAVIRDFAPSFRFKLTADFPAGVISSTTDYELVCPIGGHDTGDLADQAPQPAINDRFSRCMNAKSGTEGIATYNWKFDSYEITEIQHVATQVRGTIVSTFSGTPGTFSVTPVIQFNGTLPTGPLTVHNIYGWGAGTAGKPVMVVWNPIDEQWEAIQMGCP